MNTPATASQLETFFIQNVLIQYDISTSNIQWVSHDTIGNDVFAHYFTCDNINYALVFEDFPSEQNFIAEEGELVKTKSNLTSVNLSKRNAPYIENQTGYFTLYKHK